HLSELRNRLLVIMIVFVVFFALGFVNLKEIYTFLIKGIDIQLTVMSPGEIIWIYLYISGVIGFIGTIPILAYQLWAYISPGLTSKEKRVSLIYIPTLFILFILGFIFGYIMFINLIFPFLLSLNDGMFNEMFTVEKYSRFMFGITLPFAFLFELPIMVMFLTKLGIITPHFLTKNRKYAYFLLIVIAAFITPPDIVMQIIIAIPLIILYEISVFVSKMVFRKKTYAKSESIS